MSEDSARLGLPYLAAGQMQKHVTLNEALTRLDALIQTAVVSRTVSAAPESPTDGALYILPAEATGAGWSGRAEGTLVRAEGGGWTVVPVAEGHLALVLDAGEAVVKSDVGWTPLGERLGALQNLSLLGLGTGADAANPLAAKINKALFTALTTGEGGDGDLRMTFNKEGAADVLSLLFQSGYGGRAELGLVGDDDLRLKVSADGSTWADAFAVDRSSGRVAFAQGAVRRLATDFTADGAYTPPAWARWIEAEAVGGGGGGGAGASGASGTDRYGGGGGAAGVAASARWPVTALTGDLAVIVGAGGAGGGDGQPSRVTLGGVDLLIGAGGLAGAEGSSSAGLGGVAAAGAGGSSRLDAAGEAGGSNPSGPGGGGAGGGVGLSNTARGGGSGGAGRAWGPVATGATGGATAGAAGSGAPLTPLSISGGGGAGGGAAASGAGHSGGAGGSYGAGGGGGGAGVSSGGAGGAGAPGHVRLIAVG